MLRALLFLLAISIAIPAFSQTGNKPPAEWAIILHLNPKYQNDDAWTDADNKAVGEHFAALQKLQKEGKLTFAGRTTVKESMGVIILKNVTEDEARELMKADKAVQRGIMKAELQPFHTALKEEAPGKEKS